MVVRSAAGSKTLVYGVDYMLGRTACASEVTIDDAPVVFVGYGVSAAGSRLRRLRGRRRHQGQSRRVPERRAGDAPEQRARVLSRAR